MLTPEQIQSYRNKYNITSSVPVQDQSTSSVPKVTPLNDLETLAKAQNIEQENPGLVQSFVQGITRAPLRLATTIDQAKEGAVNLAKYGLLSIFGNESDAQKALEEADKAGHTVDMGYFGKINPIGFNNGVIKNPVEWGKDVAGNALENTALMYGGGSGAGTIATGLKGRILQGLMQGAKSGFITGALTGAGTELQKEGSTAEDILKSSAIQGSVGGLIGGTIGATVPIVKNTFDWTKETTGRAIRNWQRAQIEKDAIDKLTPQAQEAIKIGIPQREVARINTSPENKQFYQQILDYAEQAESNPRAINRPENIPGKQLVDTVDFLNQERKIAGKRLQQITQNLPTTPIDTYDTSINFIDNLRKDGVKFEVQKGGGTILNFDDSRFAKTDADKSMLQFVYDKITRGGDAKQLQIDKQAIQHTLFNSDKPLSSEAQIYANQVVKDLGEKISQISPDYAEANSKYAASSEAIKDFYKAIGQTWRGEEGMAKDIRVGEVLNRISSNSSANVIRLVDDIQQTAKILGYDVKGNIADQVEFLNLVKNMMGQAQKTSLAGQVEKGTEQAVKGVMGGKAGIAEKIVDFATQITPAEKMRALRLLIDSIY